MEDGRLKRHDYILLRAIVRVLALEFWQILHVKSVLNYRVQSNYCQLCST